MITACIVCYRCAWTVYDPERVWQLVQRHGGYMEPKLACVDFYISVEYQSLLVMAFPRLTRRPELDYV